MTPRVDADVDIATERLLLRRWRDADREPWAELNGDPEVMRHFPSTLSRGESDAAIDRYREHFAEHGYGLWVVERRDDGTFLGFVGLNTVTFDEHFTPALEIGWRLARHAWGHGFATEAARAVVDQARSLGIEELVSFTVPANEPSWRVMERIGMTHDEADDFDHPRVPAGDPLERHVLYRLRLAD
jgi:RimJ/RimL family protein N-acetyltransferase